MPRTMQSVGRRYAQYFNRTYHRSGSLWEGRYKSALVDTERYLLACYRYIELNSVRAGIARRPEDYPYSSFHANGLGKADKLITPHKVYSRLIAGEESEMGRKRYLLLFDEAIDRKIITEIRRGTEKGVGIGQADFLLKIARLVSN